MKSIPAIGRWTGSGSGGRAGSSSRVARPPYTTRTSRAPIKGCSRWASPFWESATGMQLIAHLEGALVVPGKREYGRAELTVENPGALFDGFAPGERTIVWCSHGDHVDAPPAGYRVLAFTETLPVAALADPGRRLYGVQFHPEVAHTARGDEVISNFLFGVCCCEPTWTAGAFIDDTGRRGAPPGGTGRPRDLRPFRRRGLLGGRVARPPGSGRPAHLRVRGQWAAPEARARHRGVHLPQAHAYEAGGGGRRRSVPRGAGRGDRTGAEAQADRLHLHRGVRRRGPAGRLGCPLPRARDPLSGRDRVRLTQGRSIRDDQDAPQRGRDCPWTCPSS